MASPARIPCRFKPTTRRWRVTTFRSVLEISCVGAYFNANQEILETSNLTAGKRYRIAISWLMPGSYVLTNKKPNMEMSLTVSRGASSFSSVMSRSNVQWVDFVAPSTGSYTIKIKRTFNAGTGNLALALTVGEVV